MTKSLRDWTTSLVSTTFSSGRRLDPSKMQAIERSLRIEDFPWNPDLNLAWTIFQGQMSEDSDLFLDVVDQCLPLVTRAHDVNSLQQILDDG